MDFVEGGVGGSDEPGGESPGPVPAAARSANAAIKENKEDEVFGEVSGLADEVVDGVNAFVGDGRNEPPENGFDNHAGVGGREGVCGGEENDGGPEQGGPPGAQPGRDEGEKGDAMPDLVEIGGGRWVAPGFGRGHFKDVVSSFIVNEG